MPHLAERVPASWSKIRETLRKDPGNHISLDDYYRVCEQFGLTAERADFLSDYLHDLGVILHFRQDKVLEHTVILKPEWATNAVYKLIDNKEIIRNNGAFTFDSLRTYWDRKKYPPHLHLQLVRLMERFELCFDRTGTDEYFVAELLPQQQPALEQEIYKTGGALQFQYRCDFMPEGIISRLISRFYYLIHDGRAWKYGVELFFENTRALVLSNIRDNRITISISGPGSGKLLGIIQANLEHIHDTLNMKENIHYKQWIPCTCDTCKESSNPHFFDYEVLQRRIAKNKTYAPCDLSVDDISIDQLLTGYRPPKPEKKLVRALLQAAGYLMGLLKTIKEDEDSRTNFIRLMLSLAGFNAREQARWGKSGTGISAGRVDLLIELPETGQHAAAEAFNLDCCDKTVIDDHLKRVFYYDPTGGPENYILVYSLADDFSALWEKYLAYLSSKKNYLYPKLSGPDIEKTDRAGIKHAVTVHNRENEETTIHSVRAVCF